MREPFGRHYEPCGYKIYLILDSIASFQSDRVRQKLKLDCRASATPLLAMTGEKIGKVDTKQVSYWGKRRAWRREKNYVFWGDLEKSF